MKPNQYIIRFWDFTLLGGAEGHSYKEFERRVFAFSAEEARLQVQLELKWSNRGHVTYIGPVNPDCKCSGKCLCGTMPRTEVEEKLI